MVHFCQHLCFSCEFLLIGRFVYIVLNEDFTSLFQLWIFVNWSFCVHCFWMKISTMSYKTVLILVPPIIYPPPPPFESIQECFVTEAWNLISRRSLSIVKEWVFFLGSLGLNRSAWPTKRVNHEAVLGRLVCSALRFITPWTQNKRHLFLICTMLQTKTLSKILR